MNQLPEKQEQQQELAFDGFVTVGATVYSPVVTRERFAESVGVTQRIVEAWIDRGYLPVVKVGRYSLINQALLTQQCLQEG